MTNKHFTHYMPEVPDDNDPAHQGCRCRSLPARPVVRDRLRLHLRDVRPAGQVADGRRLDPHRRGHRTDGDRRTGDGHLRHHRQAGLVPRGPAAPQDRDRLRARPDRRGAAVLLQRRCAPVGRCRAAAGVHRPHPGGGLAVGHHAAQAHLHDARRCRSRDRRNHLGAGRRFRCSHQHDRRGVGTGRRRYARRATS